MNASFVITDPKHVTVTVPAEPVSEHQIHSFIVSELETAYESLSSQPHAQHLLAAAPESRPSDSSTPGCDRSGRNVRWGVTEKRICAIAAAIQRGGGRGGSELRALTAAPQLRHTMNYRCSHILSQRSLQLHTLLHWQLWYHFGENMHDSSLVTESIIVVQIKQKGENSWNPCALASGLTAIAQDK